jgi:predicted ATPase
MIGALSPTPLPRRLSSFIGRQEEIEELRGMLARGRLLTLTGAGGCGKTRLGLELAARMSPDFEDGVAFADLALVHDPVAVPELIAVALGLEAPAARQIPALIAEASLLLLIDNAEHLVDAVSTLVADYVARCPNLHILVTSRELLSVEGELSWRVPPLSLPPADSAPDSQTIFSYDAVQLFLARVAEHQPSFRLSDTNARLIANICRRLDGIPLALELAAARVRSLALADMAKRLDDSFSLLTRGPRTTLSRHRSLRATIDWSYLLLDEREQRLLRRLSVFADTFELTAVEAVCSAPDLPPEEIADSLHRLADKSLVAAEPDPEGSLRYRQLEVIRQYGRERLLAAGEGVSAGRGLVSVRARSPAT